MEALITSKTSGLCFNKDDFIVKDFSVDKFVSNYRKYVSLETLLEDLGVYHKILCSAMIELINMDYADFVNLSSNLVGLDKSIKTLSLPLEKLKAEVEDMKASLSETLDIAKTKFLDYSSAYKMKVLAHHALFVLKGLDKIEALNAMIHASEKTPSDILERMALDFNIVEFHMSKISCLKGFEHKKMVIEEIAESLIHYLEQLFLQSLASNDSHSLNKVLRIYAVIDKTEELENFFAQTAVRPYMEIHITEEAVVKLGLSYVYDKILSFISTSSAILDATRGTKKHVEIVPGYDFLVNAIWPEAVRCFNLIAPVHVFAHGDPELFHKNYSATVEFLDRFEHYCQIQKSVSRLRTHESYREFLNKWNLDIYFQIRFQEIAGKFENSLITDSFIFLKSLKEEKKSKNSNYLLNASLSAIECIKLCWNDKIFLKPLGYSFFRLNLQIVSRFYNSACSYLKCENAENKSLNPLEAAAVIRDVEILITELTKLFENRICLKIDKSIAEVAFKESIKLLEDIIPLASSLMIKSLTKQCCAPLKSISDIPRLYRKTNREVPSKPSSYVSSVFKSLTDFIAETESILPTKSKKFCLKEVINGIIVECNIMVYDVLTAIKKMEDSLKILKKRGGAREKNPTFTSGSMSDDDKIRRQLIIDVTTIEEKARSLGLDIDSLKSFKELKMLMNSTEKTLPKNNL